MAGLINLSMFEGFLEKKVQLETGGYKLSGRLRAVERLGATRHPPLILILDNGGKVSIVRGCTTVGIVKQQKTARKKKLESQT